MDLHISPSGDIPIDELIEKHKADLTCQHQYDVEFKSLWVNKEKGMVFCLMEGPNKDACISVHQKAHGDTGCNIIEVDHGDYNRFLAISTSNTHDIAEIGKGIIDDAYRTILRFEIINPLQTKHIDANHIKQIILTNRGRHLINPSQAISAVFVYPSEALKSAQQIQKLLTDNLTDYRLNFVSGKPVDQHQGKLYGYVRSLSDKLALASQAGQLATTQTTINLLQKESSDKQSILRNIQVLSLQEENFLVRLMNTIDQNCKCPTFNTHKLAQELLLSRSQLFKKIKSVTGYTPNTMIREVRLYNALKLIKEHNNQIAHIALDSGFNSPSYFTKMFVERFGILPSVMIGTLKKQ